MSTNRLAKQVTGEKSPTDPQECCDWANSRLEGYPEEREWRITGKPAEQIELFRKKGVGGGN